MRRTSHDGTRQLLQPMPRLVQQVVVNWMGTDGTMDSRWTGRRGMFGGDMETGILHSSFNAVGLLAASSRRTAIGGFNGMRML